MVDGGSAIHLRPYALQTSARNIIHSAGMLETYNQINRYL